jgi:putative transposase
MNRNQYGSDLTNEEWDILASLIPPAKPGGRPRTTDIREVLNAIFYILRSGCSWRLIPHDLPSWQTVYDYFCKWRISGLWEQINTTLREKVRRAAGRDSQPSASIIDSQSVKTTERGGIAGYDGGKKINGRKRHLLVDTMGLVLKAKVHAADMADRDGAKLLLEPISGMFSRLRHCWVDMGYRGDVIEWIKQKLGWTVDVVKRPSKWGRYPIDVEPPPMPAFTVLPRRWVVERTFAWIGRNRRMSKDYEYLPETGEAWIYTAMSRLMLRRLAKDTKEAR